MVKVVCPWNGQAEFHQQGLQVLLRSLLAVKTDAVMHGRNEQAECVCHDVIGLGLSHPVSREFFHRELCLWSRSPGEMSRLGRGEIAPPEACAPAGPSEMAPGVPTGS